MYLLLRYHSSVNTELHTSPTTCRIQTEYTTRHSEISRERESAITALECHGQHPQNCAIVTKYSNFQPRCSVANQSQSKL